MSQFHYGPAPLQISWDAGKDPYNFSTNTHAFLVDKAVQLIKPLVYSDVSINPKVYKLTFETNAPKLADGLRDADEKLKKGYLQAFAGHFFDPDNPDSSILDKMSTVMQSIYRALQYVNGKIVPASVNAYEYFILATRYWTLCNYPEAANALGFSLHFLADIGMPMHASLFTAFDPPIDFHPHVEIMAKNFHSDVILSPDEITNYKSQWPDLKALATTDPKLQKKVLLEQYMVPFGRISKKLNEQIVDRAVLERYQYVMSQPPGMRDHMIWGNAIKAPLVEAMKVSVIYLAGWIYLWCASFPYPRIANLSGGFSTFKPA
ncbi:MAG: hypothetical protein RLZ12_135 [Bacillota bacterium]|jgi:hypothetical protein